MRSPRILGGRLTRSTFRRLGRKEKEEEDICRQDDSAREGGREGIGTTDGIRSGRERKGARIADGVGDEMALGKGGRREGVGSCRTSPSFPVPPRTSSLGPSVRCEASGDGNARGRKRSWNQ